MVISHFVNRKTGLAADTDPVPAVLVGNKFQEVDTGRVYNSVNGSSNQLLQGFDKIEVLENKTIPAEDNELTGFDAIFDHPFLKNFEQKGYVIPATTPANSFHGLIEGATLSNANNVKIDPETGIVVNFDSLVDDAALGFVTPIPVARRDRGYEILAEVESNAQSCLFGFSTANAFNTTQVLDNSEKGVVIGWLPGSTFITAYNNDGTGVPQITPSTIPKGRDLHTFEIILTTANIKCIIDGTQTLTLTTLIPGATDNLYLLGYGFH